MILFILLAAVLLAITAIMVITVGIGGGFFVILFGDVIVCIALILYLMKKILNK